MNAIFDASSLLVMPFWALMVFAPTWRVTKRIIDTALPWIVMPACLLYAVLVIPDVANVWTTVSNPELASIQALLATPAGATIAWVHFLAFDLFVGRWVYLDSRRWQLPAWLVAPTLFLTLMLGPVGLLTYLGVRALLQQRRLPASLEQATAPSSTSSHLKH